MPGPGRPGPRPTLGRVGPALHLIEAGTGPTTVLVHGAMDRAGGLAKVARHLPDQHVVRYDRRGYAGSTLLGPGTLDDHAADLVALLRELVPTPAAARPVVVGHSMGGLVALAAARTAPDLVAAVGAYEPPTPWHRDWPPGIEEWEGDDGDAADAVIARAVGAERWARAPAALRAARRAEGGAMMAEMRSLLAGGVGCPPAALGPVAVPAVLARGSASRPHVESGLADLAAHLALAPAVVLEGPGHRAPTTHAALLASWVTSLRERAPRRAVVREP